MRRLNLLMSWLSVCGVGILVNAGLLVSPIVSAPTSEVTESQPIKEKPDKSKVPESKKTEKPKSNFASNLIYIDANEVEYRGLTQNISAKGEVSIKYGPALLTGEEFYFTASSNTIEFVGDFKLSDKNVALQGQDFYYETETYKGHFSDFSTQLDRLRISGTYFNIEPLQVSATNIGFTTCSLDHAHYRLKAKKLYIYPEFGFFVSFNNFLYLRFLPFPLWFPTFVYGNREYSLLAQTTPIPRIGSNSREGVYIKQSLPYYLNPKSTGAAELGWTQNLGWIYGARHQFNLPHHQNIRLTAINNGADGWNGGIMYEVAKMIDTDEAKKTEKKRGSHTINPNISTQADSNTNSSTDSSTNSNASLSTSPNTPVSSRSLLGIDSFIEKFRLKEQEIPVLFQARYLFNELVNNSRVNYLPELTLKLTKIDFKLFDSPFELNAKQDIGYLEERAINRDDTVSSAYSSTDLELVKHIPISTISRLNLAGRYISNRYRDDIYWTRYIGEIQFEFNTFLHPIVSYKRLISHGSTFFDYEGFDARNDEVGLRLSHAHLNQELDFETQYNTVDNEFRQLNIGVKFILHCVKPYLKWRIIEGQFDFGAEIY